MLENVRAHEGPLAARLRRPARAADRRRRARRGFFWAIELVRDAENARFDAAERDRLLRGFLPRRLLEAGLIARADDRGDSVLQIAPPLISDAAVLDELVDGLAEVLDDAGREMGLGAAAAVAR